jgi:hypothetical protein
MPIGIMRLVAKYFSFSRRERSALYEAAFCLVCARLLLLVPFRRVAPFLGRAEPVNAARPVPVPALSEEQRREAVAVRRALLRISRHLPWHSSCLVCAIAGRMMLRHRHMPSLLQLGARIDSPVALAAHAWLRSGDVDVSGADVASQYSPIVAFEAPG